MSCMMPPIQEAATNVDEISDLMYNVTLLEVFVDDLITLTDNLSQSHLLQLSCVMLHGINTVFPLLEVTYHNGGDPIPEKKLSNIDEIWDHIKEILGWIMDGENLTICLPTKKVDKIVATLKSLCKRKNIKLLEFQKLAGTMYHVAMVIPGGQGIFTTIWEDMENCNLLAGIPLAIKLAFTRDITDSRSEIDLGVVAATTKTR